MKNFREFYICKKCGNLVAMIQNAGVSIKCCGDNMSLLQPNTTEAAHEKHLPVAHWDNNELTVKVGSTTHPMTEEHHISWIAIAHDNTTQIVKLNKTDKPEAKFFSEKADVTIYEYCNLHGLWAIDNN